MFERKGWSRAFAISLAILVCVSSGCTSVFRQASWPTPTFTRPNSTFLHEHARVYSSGVDLVRAEVAYATGMAAMDRGNAECVDQFFRAGLYAWQAITNGNSASRSDKGRATEIYKSSLNAIVAEGQHYGRFDPKRGLKVRIAEGWTFVPCRYYGFTRIPDEFHEVITVGNYSTKQLNHLYRQDGLGVPTIVLRHSKSTSDFQRKQSAFVATLLLRLDLDKVQADSVPLDSVALDNGPFALEFHDPLRSPSIVHEDKAYPLAYDKSAPVARALMTTQRNYVRSFLQPGAVQPDEEGLFILEPYQANKIPIVLVHGLLSDRLTWANLVNEIHARPWLSQRYQLWGFEYPTGMPFLQSAAMLRRQLGELRTMLDPEHTDEALDHAVLVGHSMGGLISKTLISSSGDRIWNTFAKRGFDEVIQEPILRERLAAAVFFEPSPMVSRVIYIGTPHRGSVLAHRAVGRLGSMLIKQPNELKRSHQELLLRNPNTFSDEFTRRIPTSIDLLDPDSELLSTIGRLPLEQRVQQHSIIGYGRWMPGSGDSDGVVPVTSARQPGVVDEKFVIEEHSKLTQNEEVIQQVIAILKQHCDFMQPKRTGRAQ